MIYLVYLQQSRVNYSPLLSKAFLSTQTQCSRSYDSFQSGLGKMQYSQPWVNVELSFLIFSDYFFPWPLCFFTWMYWPVHSWISERWSFADLWGAPSAGSSSVTLSYKFSLGDPTLSIISFTQSFVLCTTAWKLWRHQAGTIFGLPPLFCISRRSLSFVKCLENCVLLKIFYVSILCFVCWRQEGKSNPNNLTGSTTMRE